MPNPALELSPDDGLEPIRHAAAGCRACDLWRPSGKRRLHERPNPAEVRACRPWLDLELGLVSPAVVVALGATAAAELFGLAFRLTKQRGVPQPAVDGRPVGLATFHPSAVLRARDEQARTATFEAVVRDLRTARMVATT